MQPTSANIQAWQNLQISISGAADSTGYTWQASQPTILANLGNGEFPEAERDGTEVGNCGESLATATVVVQSASVGPHKESQRDLSGNWGGSEPEYAGGDDY